MKPGTPKKLQNGINTKQESSNVETENKSRKFRLKVLATDLDILLKLNKSFMLNFSWNQYFPAWWGWGLDWLGSGGNKQVEGKLRSTSTELAIWN